MTQNAARLPTTPTANRSRQFRIDVHHGPQQTSTLASDVLAGLSEDPKSLPPKHFYDARGSELFEQICNTEEYYPTRSELALLEEHASFIVQETRPACIVELGSGSARKIRRLLNALEAETTECTYVPFDVSRSILEQSGRALGREFPWLRVHAIVGDYDRHLGKLPRLGPTLFMFLGGTIGNFDAQEAIAFLSNLAAHMHRGDHLLLGTDLVKDHAVLDRAYNDEQGITAAFNKNVLGVINRQLGGSFDLDAFDHIAFFEPSKEQIEMHLESSTEQTVRIDALGMQVKFARGERILTEISRKFTRRGVQRMLNQAGLNMRHWLEPDNGYFGLSLARR